MAAFRNTPLLALVPDQARISSVRGGFEWSAGALARQSEALALRLCALGLSRGDRVIVAAPDGARYLVAVFACWISGLCAVAVNPLLSAQELKNVIAATNARALVAEDLSTFGRPDKETPPGPPAGSPLGLDELALILMTSGTTGRPKGIVHSLRSLLCRIHLNIAAIGRETMADTLCVLPVFFGHGLIGNCLTPLVAGGRLHIWPQPELQEIPRLGAFIGEAGIGFMSSVPSFWKIALRVSNAPQNPLRRIHVGSAPLSSGLWQDIARWGGTDAVFNMFGMTETANWISGGRLGEANGREGFVGSAWGGGIAVLSDAGDILPAGRGEVIVQSPSIMLGYWRRPDLAEEAFIDGWFRTGDVGELDEAGGLSLVGRIKSEINRAGIKILAEEIDMLLERHPDIVEACAFGIPDAISGEAVAAAIVLRPHASGDLEAIKAWCRGQASHDKTPARLHVVEAIPRNDRGKIVRVEVRRTVEATA
jgi:acyl-CoA synthetase (AMP-forming)/AMP-acid ligase II